MKLLRLPNAALAAGIALLLAGCGSSDDAVVAETASSPPQTPIFATEEFVSKVTACGTGDVPETGLQGQVPAALRASGFKGFNCNLQLVGQLQGEGGTWSAATFKDKAGNRCAYHATTAPNNSGTGQPANRQNLGVPVIDISNPAAPKRVTSLTTKAMLDPWESLRVHHTRQLLVADNGTNGGGGPELDIYDLSQDCRSPQLMSSVALTYTTGDPAAPEKPISGHEGNLSPDGLTYYVGDIANGKYHAVDITNPTRPRVIASYDIRGLSPIGKLPHGLSISPDGNRAYVVAIGDVSLTSSQLRDPNYAQNGFIVLDTSDVQARKPNPQIRVISSAGFKDGSIAQHTIETKVNGKPYVVMVDEGGSAGIADATTAKLACSIGLAPFPMARIIDMTDEKNPKLVSKMGLETHNVKNCDTVLPDITGLKLHTYGSHYCSVDSRENATAMACSYFNSGIRVFDIRDPAKPKEIAYFNPPSTTSVSGSFHAMSGEWRQGGPDWCTSRLDFDKETGTLTTMCQDNGLLVMKFREGTWPFSQTVASTLQN